MAWRPKIGDTYVAPEGVEDAITDLFAERSEGPDDAQGQRGGLVVAGDVVLAAFMGWDS